MVKMLLIFIESWLLLKETKHYPIYCWIEAFEAGQLSIEDAPRPYDAVTPSNIDIIEDLINNDPHITKFLNTYVHIKYFI